MKKFIVACLLAVIPLVMSAKVVVVKDLVEKTGALSVDETIAKIETIVKSKEGMGVFTVIDHAAAAKKAGLEMADRKVILFGNPQLGTKLMEKDPRAGLDLPLRVLVYKDSEGKTKLVYHNPKVWQQSFDLQGCKLIDKMVEVLDMITEKASLK
jgi:uncharacterized protein (DUF302 family)